MGDESNQAFVGCDHGGRCEGDDRVLHSSKGKAGREDQQFVACPAIGAVEMFDRFNECFQIFELACGGGEDGGVGIDARARTGGEVFETADGEGDQVSRDGMVHAERVFGGALRAHDRLQAYGDFEMGVVSDANAGRVLDGNPAAGVNGLVLTEEEGVRFAGGLFRGKPLQSAGGFGGVIADENGRRIQRELDTESAAEDRVRFADRKFDITVTAADFFNGQVASVEEQRGGKVAPFEFEARTAVQLLAFEIDVEVERAMSDPDTMGLGE